MNRLIASIGGGDAWTLVLHATLIAIRNAGYPNIDQLRDINNEDYITTHVPNLMAEIKKEFVARQEKSKAFPVVTVYQLSMIESLLKSAVNRPNGELIDSTALDLSR
jgi:hypothetical protein